MLFHNSKKLGIEGGVFANNRRQIEVDKQSDDVNITNALIIGFSRLNQLKVEAGNRKSHCPASRPLVGVQLHSFFRCRDSKGYKLKNVTFEDLGTKTGCVGSTAIEMDEQLRDGHFNAFSSFYNLKFPEGIPDFEKYKYVPFIARSIFIRDLVLFMMRPATLIPMVVKMAPEQQDTLLRTQNILKPLQKNELRRKVRALFTVRILATVLLILLPLVHLIMMSCFFRLHI